MEQGRESRASGSAPRRRGRSIGARRCGGRAVTAGWRCKLGRGGCKGAADPPEDAQQQAGYEEGGEGARHDHGRLQGGQVAEQAGDAGHQGVTAAVGAAAAAARRLPGAHPGGVPGPRAGRWPRLVLGSGLRRGGGLGSAGAGGGRGQEREQHQQRQKPRGRRRGAHGAVRRPGVGLGERDGALGPAPATRPSPATPAAEPGGCAVLGRKLRRPEESEPPAAAAAAATNTLHGVIRRAAAPRGRGRPPGPVRAALLSGRPQFPRDLAPPWRSNNSQALCCTFHIFSISFNPATPLGDRYFCYPPLIVDSRPREPAHSNPGCVRLRIERPWHPGQASILQMRKLKPPE